METRNYIVLALGLVILFAVVYLLTKPLYYITEKQAGMLEANDEIVIQEQPYFFQYRSDVPGDGSLVQLNLLDSEGEEVTVTVKETDPVPVKVEIDWWDVSPVPPPPPPSTIPAPVPAAPPPPVPVEVPVPQPPNATNVTPPPPPTAPNVSVPTPPNVTTPPPPTPPNATAPLPPAPVPPNATVPTPPNATAPPPPPPAPVNVTPPTPYPATCYDGTWNGDESDLDCGGSCPQCLSAGPYNYCWDNSDCASGNCDTTAALRPLPSGHTIQSIRQLAGQTWIIPYQGQCQ